MKPTGTGWSQLSDFFFFFPLPKKELFSWSVLLGKTPAGCHLNPASIHQKNIKKITETKILIK